MFQRACYLVGIAIYFLHGDFCPEMELYSYIWDGQWYVSGIIWSEIFLPSFICTRPGRIQTIGMYRRRRVGQTDVKIRSDNERKTAKALRCGPLEHSDSETSLVRLVSAEIGAVTTSVKPGCCVRNTQKWLDATGLRAIIGWNWKVAPALPGISDVRKERQVTWDVT